MFARLLETSSRVVMLFSACVPASYHIFGRDDSDIRWILKRGAPAINFVYSYVQLINPPNMA